MVKIITMTSIVINNRAVKIPLLPMLIVYFGLTYSIILMIVMILISLVQGITTEKAMEVLK